MFDCYAPEAVSKHRLVMEESLMVTMLRVVGDWLLVKLVPQTHASACTPPERECRCEGDASWAEWCCEQVSVCAGGVVRRTRLGCTPGCA